MTRQHLIWTVFLAVTAIAFIQQTTFQLGTVPKELPKIDTTITKISWEGIVQAHYKYFVDTSFLKSKKEITQSTFGGVYDWMYKGKLFSSESYKMVIKSFYSSPTVRLALYKWIKPYYMDAYKKLPEWKKSVFKEMLADAKKYISEFNYNAELKIFNEKPTLFHYTGPKGYRGDFGRMQAFIFRRVHNGDMTLQQISQWVSILQKDINSIK